MSDPFDADRETAVSEPVVRTRTRPRDRAQTETHTKHLPPYNVIILNDEVHTFGYVIEMLTKLFAHSVTTAGEMAVRIHTTGRAVVYTTHKEKAELKRDQVLAYGPDPHSSQPHGGSMNCYIEPAPTD